MIESSLNLIKREIEFMCGPWNCCNMSSCERKCRPRDPFPTIAGPYRGEEFCLEKSPHIKMLIFQCECLSPPKSLLTIIHSPCTCLYLGQIRQLDFGCWNLIGRTEDPNLQMEVGESSNPKVLQSRTFSSSLSSPILS